MFTSKSSMNKLENIQKRAPLRFVCNDLLSNYSELLEKCSSQEVKLMPFHCMPIYVYKCVKNMYVWSERQLQSWKGQQHGLKIMVSNPSKFIVPKYGTYSQQHIKRGCHLIHSKIWSNLDLDHPANLVSAVCLQLDFPTISMYNNLTNHNCLLCYTGIVD